MFAVVLARLSGIFMFAPILGSVTIPRQAKALLIATMTLVIYPTIDHAPLAMMKLDLISLAPLMLREALIGFCIGFIASMPLLSVEMGGRIMSQQMALRIAEVFNPALETESDGIGQLLLYLAIGSFIAMGGLESMFVALMTSFATIPPGGFLASMAPLDLILALAKSGLELAMRVSAPVVCLLLLESVLSGFLMKTVPQINVLTFGFPIKILAGLVVLASGLGAIHHVTRVEVEESIETLTIWAQAPIESATVGEDPGG